MCNICNDTSSKIVQMDTLTEDLGHPDASPEALQHARSLLRNLKFRILNSSTPLREDWLQRELNAVTEYLKQPSSPPSDEQTSPSQPSEEQVVTPTVNKKMFTWAINPPRPVPASDHTISPEDSESPG